MCRIPARLALELTMCGIVGKVDFGGAPIDRAWLNRACDLLAHRGPDRQQAYVDDGEGGPAVALGHRRLRVIDLDPCADQPMTNRGCVEAGRASALTIVFNGEIYNYRELRLGLEARGHRFSSASDTEVVLHLFEEEGIDAVKRLRGMFALAVWDHRAQALFCARDRLGKKPFYYAHRSGAFWFASEPRAILADAAIPEDIRPAAIAEYLALGYVPGPGSAFEALRRIPPAHYLRVAADGLSLARYWALPFAPKAAMREEEAVEAVRARVADSVRARLASDVPLGALLSGGIDSTIVVGTMAREMSSPVRTFSIGFGDPQYDELSLARETAARFRTEHHEFTVEPDAAALLPALAWHYGEPYADSSALAMFHVARLARTVVTVALNGDGGDELFAGYRRYVAHSRARRFDSAPAWVRRAARTAAGWLPAASTSRSRLYDAGRFLRGVAADPVARYASWFGFFADPKGVLNVDVLPTDPLRDLRRAFDAGRDLDPVDQAAAADLSTYLPDDLLVKADIATMAYGLEGRSPLLDHELAEFAATLPVSLKVRGGTGKYLLRRAFPDLLRPDITNRTKTGFGIPLDRWFRGSLGSMLRDLVLSPGARCRDLVSQEHVTRLLHEHASGRAAHGHRLWAVLMLELWFRTPHRSVASVPTARTA